ncbi:MAG: hypothetical protein ACLT1T_08505 [Oscillospiraceae bacterium]
MGKELELLQKMELTAENRQKLETLITEAKKTGKVSSSIWSKRSTTSTPRRRRPSSSMTFWSRPGSRSTCRTCWI